VIPALEYLTNTQEGGPLRMPLPRLLLWALGISFFGLVFAILLRNKFVVNDKLPFPGAQATAAFIKTLHAKEFDA
jgi:uncharacterized oligopeptide transporter (OPT) family protein